MRAEWLLIGLLSVFALTGLPKDVQGGPEDEGDETDRILLREAAARRISAIYSGTTNDFLAAGGDNFSVFLKGQNQRGGPIDLKVLINYLEGFSRPFAASIEGRIVN